MDSSVLTKVINWFYDEETIVHERMLNFENGTTQVFNIDNFLEWIKDDQQLWSTLSEMPTEEVNEKLFKSLLIYDDRHSVFVKKN